MEAARGSTDPAGRSRDADRLHLHFALGKAYAEAGEAAAAAFRHYAAGNAIRAGQLDYEAAETAAVVDAAIATFTAAFFAAHAGCGDPAPDPIFILGMPRAGQTLAEQLLASDSEVERTAGRGRGGHTGVNS